MTSRISLYIVASPRPRVGKTLLARLLMEYFFASERALIGFDLNPREPALAGRFPASGLAGRYRLKSADRWNCSTG